MSTSALTRAANTAKRNQKLRDAFYACYTNQPRPRKLSREYVVNQLAEEYFFSVATVETLMYAG